MKKATITTETTSTATVKLEASCCTDPDHWREVDMNGRGVRSKRRYEAWLRIADLYPDLTFGMWIKGVRP